MSDRPVSERWWRAFEHAAGQVLGTGILAGMVLSSSLVVGKFLEAPANVCVPPPLVRTAMLPNEHS